jgi:hypothetical protein
MKALDFAIENSVHSMKLSSFLETVEKFRHEGQQNQADLILKRITEIKRVRFYIEIVIDLSYCSLMNQR